MLQKISHIIFASLLMISTIGMVVSKHYCGGEMVSVTFFHEEESCCDMNDCCQNETFTFQVEDDFSTPVISTIPNLATFDILEHELLESENILNSDNVDSFSYITESRPPKSIQTILSLRQVYLL